MKLIEGVTRITDEELEHYGTEYLESGYARYGTKTFAQYIEWRLAGWQPHNPVKEVAQ